MIQEVSGDILLTKAAAIAHGIGVNDDFKSGLAMSLRAQWPALYKDFRHWCHLSHRQPGTIWVWQGVEGKRIINLLTQEAPSAPGQHAGPAHLEFVNHALRDLAHYLVEEKVPSVALPRLSTGVGRLAWNDVFPLIQKHLGSAGIPVYVYTTYHKGQKAEER